MSPQGLDLRFIRPSLYLFILVCFFMPFMAVSCGNQGLMTYTGIQLSSGITPPATSMKTPPVNSNNIVGRLGRVTDNGVPIYALNTPTRILSYCNQGQNLAISGQNGLYYLIVMVDKSTGMISKSVIQLLDYQVTNNQASQALPHSGVSSIQIDQLVRAAFVFGVSGFVVGLFGLWKRGKWSDWLLLVTSIGGMTCLLIDKARIDNESSSIMQKYPFLHIEYGYGFWLVTFLFVASIFASSVFCRFTRK